VSEGGRRSGESRWPGGGGIARRDAALRRGTPAAGRAGTAQWRREHPRACPRHSTPLHSTLPLRASCPTGLFPASAPRWVKTWAKPSKAQGHPHCLAGTHLGYVAVLTACVRAAPTKTKLRQRSCRGGRWHQGQASTLSHLRQSLSLAGRPRRRRLGWHPSLAALRRMWLPRLRSASLGGVRGSPLLYKGRHRPFATKAAICASVKDGLSAIAYKTL
jgi:hypothetical protein